METNQRSFKNGQLIVFSFIYDWGLEMISANATQLIITSVNIVKIALIAITYG